MNAPNGSFINLPPDVGDMWERFTTLTVTYAYHEHTLFTNPNPPSTLGDVITEQRDNDLVETQAFSRVSVKAGGTAPGEFFLGLSRVNQTGHEMQVLLGYTPVYNATAGTTVTVVFYVPGFPPGTNTTTGEEPTGMGSADMRRLRDDEMSTYAPTEIGFRAARSGLAENGVLFDYNALLSGSVVIFTKTQTFPDTTGSIVTTYTVQLT